ncbi:hypothetical protein [Janthinobacterium sp.]|uniref:hypothetical protein n=1 Tax=Janthinobacterium sp. TaxID=1871054 RepID=UPI00293D3CA4|nr:hypothetical protein [Janthinobacterium sp.]
MAHHLLYRIFVDQRPVAHLSKLGPREDDPKTVEVGEGKTGRVDLMLQKVVQPRTGQYDYLIVELKRPSQKINDEVLVQIKNMQLQLPAMSDFPGFQQPGRCLPFPMNSIHMQKKMQINEAVQKIRFTMIRILMQQFW